MLRQFVKFGLVGGAGVVVNMAVAIAMNKLNGGTINAQRILFAIPATPFNFRFTSLVWIVGFLVANLFNFQLNRSWTFRGTRHAPWFTEFWPFLAVGSAAAADRAVHQDRLHQPEPRRSTCPSRGSTRTPGCSRGSTGRS